MPTLIKDIRNRAWLLLLVATWASYGLRAEGMTGLAVGGVTLTIVYFKGRLIVLDFMELRGAPAVWRAVIEGWLVVVTGVLFTIYCMGARTPV